MITSPATPRSKSAVPIFVTDIARAIKAGNGTIWHTGKADFGFYVLAEVADQQIRVIIAKPGQPAPADQKGIHTHVVTTLDDLQAFLHSLCPAATVQ